jgi:hypothetical protein
MIIIRHCQSNLVVGKSTDFQVQEYHIEKYQVSRRQTKERGSWIISADVLCSDSTVITIQVKMKTCIGDPSFKLDMLVEEKDQEKENKKDKIYHQNRISKSFVKYELLKNAKEYIFKTRIGAIVNHGFLSTSSEGEKEREQVPMYDVFVDLTPLLGVF